MQKPENTDGTDGKTEQNFSGTPIVDGNPGEQEKNGVTS